MNKLIQLNALLSCAVGSTALFPTLELVHKNDEVVFPLANSLTSTDGVIPFSYFDLQFCRPKESELLKYPLDSNLGLLLRGEKPEPTMYRFGILKNETCKPVECPEGDKASPTDIANLRQRVIEGYRANMMLDNLPLLRSGRQKAGESGCPASSSRKADLRGVPLGRCISTDEVHLYNHIDFTIKYNKKKPIGSENEESYYVVGFFGEPKTMSKKCDDSSSFVLDKSDNVKPVTTIPWSYSVSWIYDPKTVWVTRWDYYINSSEADSNARQHWLRITQSILVTLCLFSVVAMILMRTLHKDYLRYNDPDSIEEYVGWKLCKDDVFRRPKNPNMLSAIVGTGVQLIGMVLTTLSLALVGFLSPANRGAFLTTAILLFVLMSFFNGLTVGVLQRMFSCARWRYVVFAGTAFPGLVFITWAIIEIMLSYRGAANAVPASTVVFLAMLWIGVSLPLCVLGASFGYRCVPIENPVAVKKNARIIPPQQWIFSTAATLIIPGAIPFAAAHWELLLLMRAVWQGQIYYVFGFLSLVFLVVIVTVAETVIVYVYYQLTFEDYRWWWKSIVVSAGMGVYYFLFSIHYYYATLRVTTWVGFFVYYSFSAISAITLMLTTAAIGFFSAWIFVRNIYSSIKTD